jgi:leucyl aminopeptidase (aminopeptidase T)
MPKPSPSADGNSKLARAILTKNLQVRPGERVTIEAWPHTLPYAVALAREARRLKALPIIHYEDEQAYWDSVDAGETKILGTKPDHEWASLAKTDVYIHMWGPGDRVRLNGLTEKKAGEVFAWNDKWYETAKKAGLRGLRLELGRAFPTLADAYEFDQAKWQSQLEAASMVPPEYFRKIAAPIVKALKAGSTVHLTHENGTDLTLGLAGYAPQVYAGQIDKEAMKRPFGMLANLPAGSVRVALDETVADGTIIGNRTSYYDDTYATEPTLEFKGGRLTSSQFATGGEKFEEQYQKGGKGRDQPGMLSIGLNPELHNTPQVEDVEAGVVMVSVGGNRFIGGKNKSPFFGWACLAGARLEVDGRPIKLPG